MGFAETGFTISAALGFAVMLGIATRKYRRADMVARRQMKWVVIEAYCAFLPPLIAGSVSAIEPNFSWLWFMFLPGSRR